jgi:hypothetical protein
MLRLQWTGLPVVVVPIAEFETTLARIYSQVSEVVSVFQCEHG